MSTIKLPAGTRRRQRKPRAETIIVEQVGSQKTAQNRNRRRRKKAIKKEMNSLNRLPLVTNNVKLRPCTAEYAVALVDPFGSRKTDPCIPDSIVLPSNKFQTKARFTMTTGSQGTGFVLFDPWHMAYRDGSLSSTYNTAPVVFTNGAYANTGVNTTIVGGAFVMAGLDIANSNSMFTNADLAGRELRLVAAGLRVTYTGSNFRNQGQVYLARTQFNTSFPLIFTIGALTQDNYTSIVPVSRKSEYCFYTPDTHDFLSYHPQGYYVGAQGGSDHFAYGIFIQGGDPASPQSWFVEAISYFEMIGPGLTLTKSHSDIEGMGIVQESLPVRNPTSPPGKVAQSVLSKVVNSLAETGKELLPIAIKYGVPALSSMITGNPAPLLANFAANNYGNVNPAAYSQPLVEEIDA